LNQERDLNLPIHCLHTKSADRKKRGVVNFS
jgi:hypothetical protein